MMQEQRMEGGSQSVNSVENHLDEEPDDVFEGRAARAEGLVN